MNDISMYYSANAPYNKASLGALIFTPSPQPPTLLLIQVSENSDPHAFSCAWGVPSGSPKPSDLTMLHALSRIILEQTGLHLSRVHTLSGSQVGPGSFESGEAKWMKLLFTVQVSGIGSGSAPAFQHDEYQAGDDRFTGKAKDVHTISRSLNHDRHQKHAWVTEADLMEFVSSGLFPMDAAKQYQAMLDAFSLYRQEAAKAQSGLVQSPTLSYAQSSSSDSSNAFPASENPPRESTNNHRKANRRPAKKKSSKADKMRAASSHFHRFRIS